MFERIGQNNYISASKSLFGFKRRFQRKVSLDIQPIRGAVIQVRNPVHVPPNLQVCLGIHISPFHIQKIMNAIRGVQHELK